MRNCLFNKFSLYILLILTVFLSPPAYSQEIRQVVKIIYSNPSVIPALSNRGLDIWEAHPTYFIVYVTPNELKSLQTDGYSTEILFHSGDEYLRSLPHYKLGALETSGAYHSYAETTADLFSYARTYPGIATTFSIGTSIQGRPMVVMKISAQPQLDNGTPRVLLMGCHHAREWISVEVPLFFAKSLLERYTTDSSVHYLINHSQIYVLPIVNPDGLYYSMFSTGDTWRLWRKNRRNNGDGSYGVDLNRNYDFHWGEAGTSHFPDDLTYCGTSAFSEPETQSIRDFTLRNPLTGAISFHSYGQDILYPWSYTDSVITPYDDVFYGLGSVLQKRISTVAGSAAYDYYQSSLLYPVGGDGGDWLYTSQSCFSFSIELRPLSESAGGFVLPENQIQPTCDEMRPAIQSYINWCIAQRDFRLPGIKLFSGQSKDSVLRLSDYISFASTQNYSMRINFLGRSTLNADTLNVQAYATATAGWNNYQVAGDYGIITSYNPLKYSSYKIQKLPMLGMTSNSTIDIVLSKYVSDSSGIHLPPSFGFASAIAYNHSALNVQWMNNSVLRIIALSNFTTPGTIQITAAAVASPPYGSDYDREIIHVYPNLFSLNSFANRSSINHWFSQLPANSTPPPSVSWLVSATDLGGQTENNVVCFSFTSVLQGIKATPEYTSHLPYRAGEWYVARMKIFSDTSGNRLQSLLYHFNGRIPDDSHIDIAANILFGTPTTWNWIEMPLYAMESGWGYPQFHLIASQDTGTIYLQSVQILKAVPQLYQAGRGNKSLNYPYRHFNSLAQLAMGWSTTQPYGEGVTKIPTLSIDPLGALLLDYSNATTGTGEMGIKLTAYNNQPGTVYTPTSFPDSEIGLTATVRKSSGDFNNYASIFMMACYGVPTNGQFVFTNPPGQLIAMGEFGRINNGPHYLAGTGRNPYHQFQFASKSSLKGILAIENVDFQSDNDTPYLGDASLF
jgi:carboxypeptidase T